MHNRPLPYYLKLKFGEIGVAHYIGLQFHSILLENSINPNNRVK
jgi:hypothetical protein